VQRMEVGDKLGVVLREGFRHYGEWKKESRSQDKVEFSRQAMGEAIICWGQSFMFMTRFMTRNG